jgi:geranylgeranyl reductase family protein
MSAYYLAERGFNVAIIEKEHFPRYKPCGGGLTHRSLQLFPFSLEPMIETEIHNFRFSKNFKHAYTRHSDEPLMYCVMRDKFDQFLVDKAIAKGAEFFQGTKVTGLTESFDQVLVHTSAGEFSASFIIGADGASSLTARTFLLTGHIRKGIAIESEVQVSPEDFARFKETVYLDWGTFVRGYAWIFPKGDHLSIGVGGPAKLSKYLKDYFLKFLESLEIKDLTLLSFKTNPIPYRSGFDRIQAGRVLLVGDAAGFTDPMTGEGIYYAVKSASIAADTIIKFLEGTNSHPYDYRKIVEQEVVSELMAAYPLLKIFNAAPGIIHGKLETSDRLWRGFRKVLRGDITYNDFKVRFGRYQFFWKPIVYLSTLIEKFKRTNFKFAHQPKK